MSYPYESLDCVYDSALKDIALQLGKKVQNASNTFIWYRKLLDAGILELESLYTRDIRDGGGLHKIEQEQLPKLREVIGKFQDNPHVEVYTKEILEVYIQAEDSTCDIRFYYCKPFVGDGKCKIVEYKSNHTRLSLECEV